MSQVEKLLLDLHNERSLKEKYLRERNNFIESYKECQADAVEIYKQLEETKKALEWYAYDAEEEARKFHFGAIHSNIGERARQALKGE